MIYTYIYILFCLSVSDKVFNYFPKILPPAKTTKICHYAKKETLNQETISQSSPEEKTFLSVFFIYFSVSVNGTLTMVFLLPDSPVSLGLDFSDRLYSSFQV